MDIRDITPDFAVTPHLKRDDVEMVAERGFRSILINRTDGEATDQDYRARIQTEAKLHGLDVQYIPIVSGTRSASLWALSQAGSMVAEAIFKAAVAVGKQASVAAANRLEILPDRPAKNAHNGYGLGPLIVSHGKALLAEFSYRGKLDPSFPNWLIDRCKLSRLARAGVVPTPAPETEQRAA